MPGPFKNRAADTDARKMSETTVTPASPTTPAEDFFLDGAAPRLGSSPMIAPAPLGSAGAPVLPAEHSVGDAAPTLAAPTLATPTLATPALAAPTLAAPALAAPVPAAPASQPMSVDEFMLPSLPAALPQKPMTVEDLPGTGSEPVEGAEAGHPMAHMMPSKSKPSAAAARAAEIRATRKAKTRKIQIGVAIGALVVAVLAGPPLVSWLTNAINEAGGIQNEEPAP